MSSLSSDANELLSEFLSFQKHEHFDKGKGDTNVEQLDGMEVLYFIIFKLIK